MDKYSINYAGLHGDMNKRKAYKYADVKDSLVKVAFDVYKFASSSVMFECSPEDIDGLWRVESTKNGEVIVIAYDSDGSLSAESQAEDGLTSTASAKDWQVIPSRDTMNIFYKGDAIRTIASSEIGVKKEDVSSFCSDVATKLNTVAGYKTSLINDMPEDKKAALLNKHPELTK